METEGHKVSCDTKTGTLILTLKITQTQTLTLKLQRGGSHSLLAGHFVTFIKIERASDYMHFWTQVQCHAMASLDPNPPPP